MASPIKNVILIGAGGNLGPAVLKEFLASPLSVTVLTRPDSKSTFPSEVKVVKSDYTLDSLKAAFAGQDAVVSLVGPHAFTDQQTVVDAAVAAGVKRFLPSEFGIDTASPATRELVPFLQTKTNVVEYLRTKEASLSWTAFVTGAFFDWGLKFGFLNFDLAARNATLWDDGNARFTTTNLATIGKGLVALLTRPAAFEQSKNEYVYVASHVTTQNEVLAALRKATGDEWPVAAEVDVEQRITATNEKLAKGDFSSAADLIVAALFSKKRGELGLLPKSWNEVLGLPKEDLELVVKEVVEGKRP